jgi:hypothetical protein
MTEEQDNYELEHLINELENSGISALDLRCEMFKRRDFSFITKQVIDGVVYHHKKQEEALTTLTDDLKSEILFGGAANGAKTWTGCSWLLFMALCYPETRYFVARNELKDLVDSVLVTFKKVAKSYGFDGYTYNAVKNFIQFDNGSHINLIEIKRKPSDPLFEDLGSTEYTSGWIEEVGEIDEVGAQVISKRAGRHMNDKYNIPKTIFYTANPKKNWAKKEFYDKYLNGTLEPHKHYIPCLVLDNPFREKGSAEDLESYKHTNKILYERLYKGNWEYEDNPYQLAEQEMIDCIFDNNHVGYGKTYITADIARYGSDKAVIIAWSGWVVKEILMFEKSSTNDLTHAIMYLRNKYRVATTRCIADVDGVGGGVVDFSGIKGFKNNGVPIRVGKETPNYRNLQVQCLYLLAEKINEGGIWIEADLTSKQQKEIKEELAQIQSTENKNDARKLDCKDKGKIKSDIGRSPDYRDALFMRVYFDLKKNTVDLSTNWQ